MLRGVHLVVLDHLVSATTEAAELVLSCRHLCRIGWHTREQRKDVRNDSSKLLAPSTDVLVSWRCGCVKVPRQRVIRARPQWDSLDDLTSAMACRKIPAFITLAKVAPRETRLGKGCSRTRPVQRPHGDSPPTSACTSPDRLTIPIPHLPSRWNPVRNRSRLRCFLSSGRPDGTLCRRLTNFKTRLEGHCAVVILEFV